jgi:hypothetical protein
MTFKSGLGASWMLVAQAREKMHAFVAVLCAARTTQSQPAESENALQVREQHLDTLAAVNSGNFERSPALSSMRRNRFRAARRFGGKQWEQAVRGD